MKSRSKVSLDSQTIVMLFAKAGIHNITNIVPLGAGEFNSLYSADTPDQSYVIKIAPINHANTLTYESSMMESEVFFYGQLREKTTIRVPKIFFSDFTCKSIPNSYFIMEKLQGIQLDQSHLSTEDYKIAETQNIEMVAQMHEIRGSQFGYRQNGLKDNWYLALSSMVDQLMNDAHRWHHGTHHGKTLRRYLSMFQTVLEKVECRMVNFDLWYPNIICHKGENKISLAWIDLERCFWGDRIADFVSLDFMNTSLNKKTPLIDLYNQYTSQSLIITQEEQIRFAIMLGYLGLIMEVEKYARYSLFHFGWWRNVAVCKMLFGASFSQLKTLSKSMSSTN